MNTLMLAAMAAATNLVADLPPVVVEAGRLNRTSMEIASHVEVVNAKEIADEGVKDLPALLERKANLFVRHQSGNPVQTSVSMRGYGENSFGRVVVTVDGERINDVDMSAPNLMRIPLGSVERVEILHGPQCVLFGDGASAGVVNIVTDGSDCAPHREASVFGGSYGTVGASLKMRGGIEEDGLIYRAGSDWIRSDGYRDNGAYSVWNANGGLRRNFANGSHLGFAAFYNHSSYEMPGSLTEAEYRSRNHPYMAQYGNGQDSRAFQWSYGLRGDGRIALDDEQRIDFTAAFEQRFRHTKWDYVSAWGKTDSFTDYTLYAYSFSPRYVNEKPLGDFGNTLIVGTDLRLDTYQRTTDSTAYSPRESHFVRFTGGGYARDEIRPVDWLGVFGGVRGEGVMNRWYGYSGRQALEHPRANNGLVAGEAGVIVNPTDNVKFFAKWSRFYRSPFCDELSYAEPGKTLEPEYGHSTDVGVEWRPTDETHVDFTYFHTETEDEIFCEPYAYQGAGYNVNAPAKTVRDGIETSVGWKREKAGSVDLAYNLAYARFDGGELDGCDVPMVPRQAVRLRGEWYLVDELSLFGGFRFTDRQRYGSDFRNEQGWLESYALFDVGAKAMPSWGVLKGVALSVAVDNLFDRKYCDYAGYGAWSGRYYYPACGRTFMVTLRYEF